MRLSCAILVVVGLAAAVFAAFVVARPKQDRLEIHRARASDNTGDQLFPVQASIQPPFSARASAANVRFSHLSVADGLSHSDVRAIAQDHQGFMWFGTYLGGLNRYDGYSFKVYRHDDRIEGSIGSDTVRALYVDHTGALWVSTVGSGIDRYEPETDAFVHYRHRPDDPDGLPSYIVRAIFEDETGTLWVGTAGGLCHFDRTSGRFYRYHSAANDSPNLDAVNIQSVGLDTTTGLLWVGLANRGGVRVLDRSTGRSISYINDPQEPASLSSGTVLQIFQDRAGTMWLASDSGLDRFDRKTKTFVHYRHGPANPKGLSDSWVEWISEDRAGRFWVATNNGLNLMDRARGTFVHFLNDADDQASLSSNVINYGALYADAAGALWIGTRSTGVDRLAGEAEKFVTYRHNPRNAGSLANSAVTGLLFGSWGELWVGTGAGLDRFNGKTFNHYVSNTKRPGSLNAGAERTVAQDAHGTVWTGTYGGGLERLEGPRVTHFRHDPRNPDSLANDSIRTIVPDSKGGLWIGVDGAGIDYFDGRHFTHIRPDPTNPDGLKSPWALPLLLDQRGMLWITTADMGLVRLDTNTCKFTTFLMDPAHPGSQAVNWTRDIYSDGTTIWVASSTGLLGFDLATGAITRHYSERDGLANNSVVSVIGDAQGDVWVSTLKGLSRFDPKTETFRNYDVFDGLQSNEFSPVSRARAPDGRLFFGGVNGLNAFYPSKLVDNPTPPPVVLTEFDLFNRSVEIGVRGSPLKQAIHVATDVTLRYDQSVFRFQFAALNYTSPQKNRYAYKLEGFDRSWQHTDAVHRSATYTNLDPGSYIFRVKASNNDGVWNEQGVAIRITILPPWWRTWWFRFAAVIFLVASIGAGHTLRLRAVEKRNRELLRLNLELQQSQSALQEAGEVQRRLNRELRAISNCNQALIRAVDEQTLLTGICNIVCQDAGYRAAWVGFAEQDEGKTIRPAAWAGIEDRWIATIGLTWADDERGCEPGGTAIRTGTTSYVADFATGPRFANWREEALRRGCRSCIALPLKGEAGAFGVLTIYSAETNAFPKNEIRLLEELAGDLAFGIAVLRARMERDKAEQSLRQSERKYRAYFEQNLAGNYISTREGSLLACNPAFLRMFGLASQAEAKDVNVASLYAVRENRELFLQQLRERGHLEYYEKEFRRKDGKPLYVTENAIAAFDECGELLEIHGFLIDETERRKTEHQLRQAQKMEAVGQLAGGIAHDFNNILGIIVGYSEILLGNPEMPTVTRDHLQRILDASQRAAALTRQLLAFSRKQFLQPEVLDLNRVVKDINEMLRRLIGEEIEVQAVLDPGLKLVEADRSQMEQVVLNLCINARDAMPEGGTITIETKNVNVDEIQASEHYPMKAGGYVRMAVSDNGVGMDKEILSHVFEPFFTTKGPEKGTGLGLATVYGIVKQSDGYIWGYSEPGQGTTFSVYLPTLLQAVTPPREKAQPVEIARGRETILLVEDSAPLRAMTRELLEHLGYTVLEAEHGERAIQAAAEYKGNISLLLTDVSLPKMKGPAVAKSLMQQRSGIAVLYMSGYANQVTTESGALKPGTPFLQKPFSQEELARKVREALDTRPGSLMTPDE